MKYPPHPSLRYCDLRVANASNRWSALPGCGELAYFFDARSALHHVFVHLRRQGRTRVLLPAFHCISMVEPAVHAGLEITYYHVDRHLRTSFDELLTLATQDVAAVVFVNYFGFPTAFECAVPELDRRGIRTIEDCSHSFLDPGRFALTGGRADFSVYSLGKVVACGTGGGLRQRPRLLAPAALAKSSLLDSMVRSKRLLEQVVLSADDETLVKRAYLALESFRLRLRGQARALPSDDPGYAAAASNPALGFDEKRARTRIPRLSKLLLQVADLRAIAARRRQNYQIYSDVLASMAAPPSVLPSLIDYVCPWAYPVLLADRGRHDVALRAQGVPVWTFGDQLHPSLAGRASPRALEDAQFLAAHLLCLPTHQGLPPEAVSEFADIVKRASLPTPPQ